MSSTRKLFLFLGIPLLILFGVIAANSLSGTSDQSTEKASEEQVNTEIDADNYNNKPILYNLGGITLAKYNAATGMAGDIEFTKDGLDPASGKETPVFLFGQKLPRNSESEPQRINPNFEFGGIKKQIDIISAIDGFVVHIEQQADSSDYEVFLSNKENGTWVVGYDHLVNLTVKKGDAVKVGQKLGLVAKQNSGDYRYELQINDEGEKLMYCPIELLDESVQSTIAGQITQFTTDWTAWYGKDVFGHNVGGCVKPSITVAESEGR